MREIEICRRADRSHHLQSDTQRRVRRHRPVLDNPRVGGFAFKMFRNDDEVIVTYADRQSFGDVDMIEFLRGLGTFL